MGGVVRVKARGPVLPHYVVDGIIDLHAAVDPDTGHMICHYLAVRPEIVEVSGSEFPGLGVGDNMTILVGDGPARAVEREGEEVDLARLSSGELEPPPDQASIGLVFALYRYAQGRVRAYRVGEAYAIVVMPERGEPVVALLWPVKKKSGGEAVLTV